MDDLEPITKGDIALHLLSILVTTFVRDGVVSREVIEQLAKDMESATEAAKSPRYAMYAKQSARILRGCLRIADLDDEPVTRRPFLRLVEPDEDGD